MSILEHVIIVVYGTIAFCTLGYFLKDVYKAWIGIK